MNYRQTLDLLYSLLPDFHRVGAGAYKPGLERISGFDALLGEPHRSFKTIHVAGTNGKGSVSHILASVLQSAGYRTGLFTSPHLRDFRERIRVDGEMIPENYVVDFTDRYAVKMRELDMSFFEATTAMAFSYFAHENVDIAVIETGLGGRLDSTNIITPILSIITNIGFDHQNFLGHTLEEIAYEKAGIIKRAVPVVIGESSPETDPVFITKAAEKHSEIYFADTEARCFGTCRTATGRSFLVECNRTGSIYDIDTDLAGEIQSKNIITAIISILVMNRFDNLNISDENIQDGMSVVCRRTGLRGRWEISGQRPAVIFDTGHNTHGVSHFVQQLSHENYRNLYAVFGMVDDKDIESTIPLLPKDCYYFFTRPNTNRGFDAAKLGRIGKTHGLSGEVVSSPTQALARAREMAGEEDLILVCGSNYLIAELLP